MTPAARVQSAIDILDRVIAAAINAGPPADRIIAEWARNHRFAGSKDRRAIRELVYRAIRACGPIPQDGRAAMLRLAQEDPAIAALFDGSQYGPPIIARGEQAAIGGIAPDWLMERLAKSDIAGPEAEALLDRAPLDLRINTLKSSRQSLRLPFDTRATDAPQGLRLEPGTPIEQDAAWREGAVEIQDTGSQLVCHAAGARPGELVVDLCAGGGGKTLQLAAEMENTGRIVACDIDRNRLSRLKPRAERAGATIIEARLLDPKRELEALSDLVGQADRVLVDAPCSGTGTWRRKPDARWRLSPERLQRFSAAQDRLLDIAMQLVRPGGALHFVTCSLLDEEGTDRAEAFQARHPGWRALPIELSGGKARGQGWRLTPYRDGTDGFFIAGFGSP